MTLIQEALMQFEEAAVDLCRMQPNDARRPEAQDKYDRKKAAILDYVKSLEDNR